MAEALTFEWQKAACRGKTKEFFPEHVNIKVINSARDVCRECPLFERCVERWLPRYPEMPNGILFGYTERQRRLIYEDRLDYHDWREEGRLITRAQLAAREKEAKAAGVRAVLDIYHIYEMGDQSQRQQVIEAYDAWCREQRYPSTVDKAHKRIERLLQVVEGQTDKRGRSLRIPVELRPGCPNGHDRKDMTRCRYNPRHPDLWICYICKAKVEAPPETLVSQELQRSA